MGGESGAVVGDSRALRTAKKLGWLGYASYGIEYGVLSDYLTGRHVVEIGAGLRSEWLDDETNRFIFRAARRQYQTSGRPNLHQMQRELDSQDEIWSSPLLVMRVAFWGREGRAGTIAEELEVLEWKYNRRAEYEDRQADLRGARRCLY